MTETELFLCHEQQFLRLPNIWNSRFLDYCGCCLQFSFHFFPGIPHALIIHYPVFVFRIKRRATEYAAQGTKLWFMLAYFNKGLIGIIQPFILVYNRPFT